MKKCLGPATTLYGTVALSFVIPSEAEGSAVPRTSPGNVFLESVAERFPSRAQPCWKVRSPALVSLRNRMCRLRLAFRERPGEQHTSTTGQQILAPVELIRNRRTGDFRSRSGMPKRLPGSRIQGKKVSWNVTGKREAGVGGQ